MKTTHSPITYALKTLTLCIVVIALVKADALSRYWQQQWRIALPLAGNLAAPTRFNQIWADYLSPVEQFLTTLNSRLGRAGQALSADPIIISPAAPVAPIITTCETPSATSDINNEQITPPRKMEWPIALSPNDKVLLVGDSMMQGVAPYVKSGLRKQYAVESVDLSKHSTGLAYPGFFNWPDTIKENLSQAHYKALVVFLGANDTWDIIYKGKSIAIGNEFWRSLYTERVESILTYAQENSVQVVWLGAPPMGQEKMNKYVPALNEVYQTSIEKFAPIAVFSPTSSSLSSDGHTFNKFLTFPDQGEVMVRTNDGVHFTPTGQKIIANLVLNHFRAAIAENTTQ
ncbi:MAG TPA: hypothetical protein VIZ65_12915 [Cellvibrionaceae bacterium]